MLALACLALLIGIPLPVQEREEAPVPPAVISVRVLDHQGRPVEGAKLALRPMRKEEKPPAEMSLGLGYTWTRSEVMTDAGGEGTLPWEGQPVRLSASVPGQGIYVFSDPVERPGPCLISLVSTPRDRLIEGIVRGPDGKPMSRTYVRFIWEDRGLQKKELAHVGRDGTFRILVDRADAKGTLHASTYGYKLASCTLEGVQAGSRDNGLQLREKSLFELVVLDHRGDPLPGAGATFYWEIEGFKVQDYPGPPRQMREAGLQWEIPDCPFWIHVQHARYERHQFGPIDPTEVGAQYTVQLEAPPPVPQLTGRVLHDGQPVAGARVTWRDDRPTPQLQVETPPKRWSYMGSWFMSDDDGRFTIPLKKRVRGELRAWHPDHGEGFSGRLEFDPEAPLEELDLELVNAPGALSGRVLVPEGRSVDEVWLAGNGLPGYMALEPDGSFLMPDLAPGTVRLRLRQGLGRGFRPASTSVLRKPESRWFSMSHGPTRAPEWLAVEPTFDAVIESGKTTELLIDLKAPATCRLKGTLRIDGSPPVHRPKEGELYFAPGYRVTLRAAELGYVSRTEIATDGSFELHANRPGTYLLEIDVPVRGKKEWKVLDLVRLRPGDNPWSFSTETGSVTVTPIEVDGVLRVRHATLAWKGAGDLRVHLSYGIVDHPVVPAGKLQLTQTLDDVPRTLAEIQVSPGERTVIESP